MSNRVRLKFNGIAEIVGGRGQAVITLTDVAERRALSVVCDEVMKYQLSLRLSHVRECSLMLPEVVSAMLADVSGMNYEIEIYDIVDGHYRVTILNLDTMNVHHIRLSDAVLLSVLNDFPIFISEDLMARQSTPYHQQLRGISIPINTLDTEKLKEELDKAVSNENYRLAAIIKDELEKRRSNTQ